MAKEIFKDVKGYEGLYQVSNLGRIKSLSRKIEKSKFGPGGDYYTKERILNPSPSKAHGYKQILLGRTRKKIGQNPLVHRLIAEHFIPNPNNYKVVHHRDGNKLNNNINNLEWISYKNHNDKLRGETKEKILKQLRQLKKQLSLFEKMILEN